MTMVVVFEGFAFQNSAQCSLFTQPKIVAHSITSDMLLLIEFDDLLPFEAQTHMQLDVESQVAGRYCHCVPWSIAVIPGCSTGTFWIMNLKGKTDSSSS